MERSYSQFVICQQLKSQIVILESSGFATCEENAAKDALDMPFSASHNSAGKATKICHLQSGSRYVQLGLYS